MKENDGSSIEEDLLPLFNIVHNSRSVEARELQILSAILILSSVLPKGKNENRADGMKKKVNT